MTVHSSLGLLDHEFITSWICIRSMSHLTVSSSLDRSHRELKSWQLVTGRISQLREAPLHNSAYPAAD